MTKLISPIPSRSRSFSALPAHAQNHRCQLSLVGACPLSIFTLGSEAYAPLSPREPRGLFFAPTYFRIFASLSEGRNDRKQIKLYLCEAIRHKLFFQRHHHLLVLRNLFRLSGFSFLHFSSVSLSLPLVLPFSTSLASPTQTGDDGTGSPRLELEDFRPAKTTSNAALLVLKRMLLLGSGQCGTTQPKPCWDEPEHLWGTLNQASPPLGPLRLPKQPTTSSLEESRFPGLRARLRNSGSNPMPPKSICCKEDRSTGIRKIVVFHRRRL